MRLRRKLWLYVTVTATIIALHIDLCPVDIFAIIIKLLSRQQQSSADLPSLLQHRYDTQQRQHERNWLEREAGEAERRQEMLLQQHSAFKDGEHEVQQEEKRKTLHRIENTIESPAHSRKRANLTNIFLSIDCQGGLGNVMFQYASLLGIARRFGYIPALPADNVLRKIFNITAPTLPSNVDKFSWTVFSERKPCAYDANVESLSLYELDDGIKLKGYFQSWRYFNEHQQVVRSEFTFRPKPKLSAIKFIQTAVRQAFNDTATWTHKTASAHRHRRQENDVTLIGVHVRRGDMLLKHNVRRGYTVATLEYVMDAMKYFERSLTRSNNLFVIVSDDMTWCRSNLYGFQSHIVFSDVNSDVVDLAILSLCDHSITTVGTYSWWAGWLAGGKTIYYSHFPRPYSELSVKFRRADYFPPHWIGL